ncbi:hypothetical protein VTH06DRAFT_6600, partial [Thermothelomyces fergusii]
MRSSTSHPPAKPPDSPADDSDTDLDLELDLEELDRQTAAAAPGTGSGTGSDQPRRRKGFLLGQARPPAEERTPRIALRTLRMSGLRRGPRRSGYGELGRGHGPAAAEDAQGLLGDGDGDRDGYGYGYGYGDGDRYGADRRYSDASAAPGDDAPLLSEPGRSPSRQQRGSLASGRLRRVGLRLPGFL